MRTLPRITAVVLLALFLPVACDDNPVATGDNLAPTADAGSARAIVDDDGDGSALVTLDGTASRDPDGTIVSYAWSDEGIAVATGSSPDVALAVGRHALVLTVTDDEGATDSDAVVVTVGPRPNLNPATKIVSPADGEQIREGTPISFAGTALDPEDGELSGTALIWTVDDERIGYGTSLSVSDLGRGEHAIVLTATDSEGGRGVARATLTIEIVASFSQDILPYLTETCAGCHGDPVQNGGICLNSYEAVTTGGNVHGPLLVPGDEKQGILIPRIHEHDVNGHRVLEFDEEFTDTLLPAWIHDGALDN
jgi:hypothetical protein